MNFLITTCSQNFEDAGTSL